MEAANDLRHSLLLVPAHTCAANDGAALADHALEGAVEVISDDFLVGAAQHATSRDE